MTPVPHTKPENIRRWIPIQRPKDRAALDALVTKAKACEQAEQFIREHELWDEYTALIEAGEEMAHEARVQAGEP